MKRTAICIVLVSIVLFSCTNNKKDMIIGKWHAIKLENPDMDSFFAKSQKYIDTVGKGNADSINIRLYGVANMDSMRKVLQSQYDTAKIMQDQAVANTIFNFRKDGIVMLSFNGNVDSSKWSFNDKGELMLDELNGKGGDGRVKMDIVTLTSAELKLKFTENSSTSTVTFHPEGK